MGDLLPDGAGEMRSGLWAVGFVRDFRRLKQRRMERSLRSGEATIVTVETSKDKMADMVMLLCLFQSQDSRAPTYRLVASTLLKSFMQCAHSMAHQPSNQAPQPTAETALFF